MRENFYGIISYDVCCRNILELLRMALTKGYSISPRHCQVLFEKYHNQSSILHFLCNVEPEFAGNTKDPTTLQGCESQ